VFHKYICSGFAIRDGTQVPSAGQEHQFELAAERVFHGVGTPSRASLRGFYGWALT